MAPSSLFPNHQVICCHHLIPGHPPSLTIAHHIKSARRSRRSSTMSSSKATKKSPKWGHLPLSTSGPEECAIKGSALLNTPYFNKGAAFPADERVTFKLTGLLPQHVSTLEQQVTRAYQQYSTRQDDLAKNTFMTSLAEQNQVLYFRVSFLFSCLIQLGLSHHVRFPVFEFTSHFSCYFNYFLP